ncbi:hypothetical protein AWV80_04030 [Cupriavidus sp. UYMU48A]|nr:hypothetical protein AWV80_04030 [Cupriavidus sp. UYMU48A]
MEGTSLEQLAKSEAQLRPDRIVGDAGSLNPWLSVAAAITAGADGPQLIMDHTQAAVLYVAPPSHDESNR